MLATLANSGTVQNVGDVGEQGYWLECWRCWRHWRTGVLVRMLATLSNRGTVQNVGDVGDVGEQGYCSDCWPLGDVGEQGHCSECWRRWRRWRTGVLLRMLATLATLANSGTVQNVGEQGYCSECWRHWRTGISLSKEWKDIYKLSRKPALHNIAFAVMDMAKKSKSDSTNKKYDLYFNKFKIWCRKFNLKFLPADVSTVSLYLTELIQSACSVSVLNSNFYAIKWYHELFLYPNPCCSSLSNIVLEGGKRILAKPIQKKEPITADIIVKLFNLYHDISNLSNCRLLCMLSLAYAGFFRYKELSLIRMSDISFHNTHVEIIVHNSKTDIYRQGSIVMIASTDMPTCPVKFLKHYCNLASLKINSSDFQYEITLAVQEQKRLLITDPDYTDNQQIHRDIQSLTAALDVLKQETTQSNTAHSTLIQQQATEIANLKIKLQQITSVALLVCSSDSFNFCCVLSSSEFCDS
ncbi:unnamed protein product [Mytilus edulis]|uniref:Tyr recombinase domain-containing protein n=1 Tax=Mytilus edulis TaxID=6550 RepID=A0A8S3PRA6_MYTED|nr:unnamed protein product [Mytilus edulis]